jgi:two-component system, LytTR family, sensor kinase
VSDVNHAPDRAPGAGGWRRELQMALAIWVPVALLTANAKAHMLATGGKPVTLRALVPAFGSYAVVALLTPLMFSAARRWPLAGRGFRRAHVGWHLAVCALCLVLYGVPLFLMEAWSHAETPKLGAFVMGTLPGFGSMYVVAAGVQTALLLRGEIHRERIRSVTLSQQLMRVELAALHARLRPDFFFEGLDAIAGLIPHDPDAADAVVARLGAFLRYSLDVADTPEVPLEQEMDALRAYLAVLSIPSRGRLAVSLAVDDEAMEVMIPPLLLQPLVDEALQHAPTRLAIQARMRGGALVLDLRSFGDAWNVEGERPAVQGVRRRLRHLYGDGEHLRTGTLPDGGQSVTLLIPCAGSEAGVNGYRTLVNG